jgi:NADH dehydrogenase/NADH:ubiquinone oxidoreductase subunit G
MSNAPPPGDLVNVEVNGVPMKGRKGAMIIHVTDANNAYVPRFCYHDKLPIAANCRMCLVEVEKAPKPLPACATPIAEGMKIFTKSPKAIAAQKATMEFLLINHPLDCPICDQGGECELQDLAVGFGRDNSRYVEGKRVVKDKNLGPLVSTDMTRCIHCTRCVRFGQDVAGIQELGTTGRGENMEIGTFIEKSVDHELSGNIIDLCPVGALNSKPFRFRARAWEMTQHPLVSPHDGFGSNLYGHVLRGKLMRVVPRPNEAVNETWIADRDRFSYEGVYSADRLLKPQLRQLPSATPRQPSPSACWRTRRAPRKNSTCSVDWPGRWAPRTSTRGCSSAISATSWAMRARRVSATRSRRPNSSTRCWSLAPTCAPKFPCSPIACARPRGAAPGSRSSTRAPTSTCSRWRMR